MRRIAIVLVIVLAPSLFIVPAAAAQNSREQVVQLDRIVAVVDNDVITETQLRRRVEGISRQLEKRNTTLPSESVLRRQVLERLIIERIQLQKARQRGIQVDDEALNEVISRMARENGLTLQRFRVVLARDGYTFAQFRTEIRNEMLIARLRAREVENRAMVSPQEVERFLSTRGEVDMEFRLFHILIALPEAASPKQVQEARRKAERVVAELRNGADFQQTAVAHSDGRQALEGGDLGWRKGGQLPTLFTDIVQHMKKGQISDPIRSPSGFHILQLADRRGEEKHIVRQTHARHILIRPNALLSDFDAKRRISRLRQRIAAGEDFAALAKAHSEDPSAAQGGDLGWSDPGRFVPEFEQAMNALKPGEVSEPVRSQFGWHLIQVLGRRNSDNTEEYRRTKAREALRQRKIEEMLQQWLQQLRDEAYVEYRLEG